MDIQGKTALVTGGASGLGRATTETFLALGANVVMVDLPSSEGETVAKELGESCSFSPGDVTSEEDIKAAVNLAAEEYRGLHVLVNCAGVGWPGRVLTKEGEPVDLDRFELVVRINLIGTYNVIRLCAAQMVKQDADGEERGVIINTASIAAFDGQIGQNAYAASKGGVVGMTLPLARDLATSKIRVVTIAPGTFDTPMLSMLPQEARDQLASGIPHPRRLGQPHEFAELAAHIVKNPMLNGEVIRLDGALRMPPK